MIDHHEAGAMRTSLILSLLVLSLSLALLAAATPTRAAEGRLNVAFLIWDGMELIESMGPAHVFSFAPGMDEYTVSKSTDPIRSEFVTIVPEYSLADCPTPDVIVLPGGGMTTPMRDPAYREWLVANVPRATLTVSVCNSAILLAELGLLDGREATCGDANIDDIMLVGKDVKGYINRRWVHSGNIITSESYLGGLDAAIYAIRVLRGEEGEKQVLDWSNYDGDLSKYDALHAEPPLIPVSRRREMVRILMDRGVDAAVDSFRQWEESGDLAYSPPLDRFGEHDLFQWMAWGNEQLERFDFAVQLCEFKAKAWPTSAKERAYLGEALMKAGRADEALACLLEAHALDESEGLVATFLEKLLAQGGYTAGENSRRAREIVRRQSD